MRKQPPPSNPAARVYHARLPISGKMAGRLSIDTNHAAYKALEARAREGNWTQAQFERALEREVGRVIGGNPRAAT